jgi:methylenetetrahydrofolate dehydrogenase (NADP+)/methenyltetrahydrofolate cyclohydrolase
MRLSGRDIADKCYEELKERIEILKHKKITPHLVVILVGKNPASIAYVKQKQKKGEEIGAKVTVLTYPTSIKTNDLLEKIELLNNDPFVHGILIQRPLPKQIDIEELELTTIPQKDIDGFHPDSPYILPLPLAVVKILEEIYLQKIKTLKPDFIPWLQSQNIVLIGKGPTGGGPIISYFKKFSIVPHIIDSKTKEPEKLMKKADIIISAVGRENTVKKENLKKGVILISVGINRNKENKLYGDYNDEEIKDIASYYTPTPGGVGPINVAMLMENLLNATEEQTH